MLLTIHIYKYLNTDRIFVKFLDTKYIYGLISGYKIHTQIQKFPTIVEQDLREKLKYFLFLTLWMNKFLYPTYLN